MKNLFTMLTMTFISLGGYSVFATSIDSFPAYHSIDKAYFSFTASTFKYFPNSKKQKVFVYHIYKGDLLVDQYWIKDGHFLKLKIIESEFLAVLNKDTVTIDSIRSAYNLTEPAYSSTFANFFQIEVRNVRQLKGRIYDCGQDRDGHRTTFDASTVRIKYNKKTVFSKKVKISRSTIAEIEKDINSMFVFYAADKTAFIAYGELFYYENTSFYFVEESIQFCNKNK